MATRKAMTAREIAATRKALLRKAEVLRRQLRRLRRIERRVVRRAELLAPDHSVAGALAELDRLGCGNDPIRFRGRETDVSELGELSYSDLGTDRASGVRIGYFSKDGWIRGTLRSMLADRMDLTKGE